MITIKSPREIELMGRAGEIVGNTHNYLKEYIKPGINVITKILTKILKIFACFSLSRLQNIIK